MRSKGCRQINKMGNKHYKSSMNEELKTFASSNDVSNPHQMKIFKLKAQIRRFWSPGVERNHYSSTQNKAINVIDKILKIHA